MIDPLSLLALPLRVVRQFDVQDAYGRGVVMVNPDTEFSVADDPSAANESFGALFSAAPDMLLALEAVAAVDDALGLNGTATGPMMAKVYAAIAKARGVKS